MFKPQFVRNVHYNWVICNEVVLTLLQIHGSNKHSVDFYYLTLLAGKVCCVVNQWVVVDSKKNFR